ncbi:hypothetical protein EBZ39_10580 [bacterium]|nr:hypothetical protein [bacterium]
MKKPQQSLKAWTEQKWRTKSGQRKDRKQPESDTSRKRRLSRYLRQNMLQRLERKELEKEQENNL